jgi:hypothetical protein
MSKVFHDQGASLDCVGAGECCIYLALHLPSITTHVSKLQGHWTESLQSEPRICLLALVADWSLLEIVLAVDKQLCTPDFSEAECPRTNARIMPLLSRHRSRQCPYRAAENTPRVVLPGGSSLHSPRYSSLPKARCRNWATRRHHLSSSTAFLTIGFSAGFWFTIPAASCDEAEAAAVSC